MRTAVMLSAEAGPWPGLVDYVVEAERFGVDVCWVAEAWGCDAVGPLGYLAARTERILLGSGILQVGARSAALTAMTALTLARLSGNRFLLGLGVSGPQVMEGLHGTPFAHPLGRMRETIEVIRRLFAGDKLTYEGRHLRLPLPGGDGKALRLAQPPNPAIPVYIAALSPKMLELTGEVADGWLGTAFVPEAAGASLEPIAAGFADLVADEAKRAEGLARLREVTFEVLDTHHGLVAGAGAIAAPGTMPDDHYWLEWWWTRTSGGPEALRVNLDPAAPDFFDYTGADWYQTPMRNSTPHVSGPYVDYACTNEYALTVAVPVSVQGQFAG
ncbi:MAG: LLM class flavin-dependent oxidoreductase, partial [Acidimicrobiia bacterium]